MTAIAPPVLNPPNRSWEHYPLYERVREMTFVVPNHFISNTSIRGVQATDLFNLSALLGAAIEEGVVGAFNSLRRLWDPKQRYAAYSFVRKPQTFPDVRLQHSARPSDVLLGIELKGWYLLAKEEEPSFRFVVTPGSCARADLFVVYPWHLSQVVSGKPQLAAPYVELARYVAEYRNYHWQALMKHRKSKRITLAPMRNPYPRKTDEITDKADDDAGRNFGRVARTGIMENFAIESGQRRLLGIQASHWRRFLKLFTENATETRLDVALAQLEEQVLTEPESGSDAIRDAARELARALLLESDS